MPVRLVVVSAGQSRTRSAGMLSIGGVESLTVICWTQVLWLPQSSIAVQVRLITLMTAPGGTDGCGGSGPSGGCCCGGGSGPHLERLPIEIVLLPTLIGSGVGRAF